MPYLIGITGGIGGGKSTIGRYLAEAGAVVIDTDAIAHELTRPGSDALDEIRAAFGDSVFLPDGSLDRKAVAAIVFNNKEKLSRLNAILHPRIRKQWLEEASRSNAPFVFVIVPLLFENELTGQFNEVWTITAAEDERIRRVTVRDGTDRKSVLRRMKNQLPEWEKVTGSDVVIDTTSGLEAARGAAEAALSGLKRRLGIEEA